MFKRIFTLAAFVAIAAPFAGCGRAGDSAGATDDALPTKRADIVGSISSQAGGQNQMAGWVIVLMERDSGIARITEVDTAGLFVLRQVNMEAAHTITLCSPDYIVQSVLAIPGTAEKTVRQFFTFGGKALPRLIHKGPVIQMQTLDGITVQKDVAADLDGDGVPDGAKTLGLGLLAEPTTAIDLDLDTVINSKDADIDGDGLVNALDPDDDQDGNPDIADLDANGDLVLDSMQKLGDLYFRQGVDFVTAQYEVTPQTDGSNKPTLRFLTKVRDDVQPIAIQMRGPLSMFNSAVVDAKDSEGQPTVIAWDRRLMDDGISEDSSSGDRLFARKIALEKGRQPRANQMVFFQLMFGTAEAPWALEFPFTFPNVTAGSVTSQFDKTTRTVQLGGAPFGALADFVWSVIIFNADGIKVYESPTIKGATEKSFVVPSNVLEAGATYTYKVVAQLLDRIPGYPTYLVHSKQYEIKP